MKKGIMKKIVMMAAAGIMFLNAAPMVTEAKMGNYNYVSIESGAVDSITVNGVTVEALYRPYGSGYDIDPTYSCAAFVKRFYSQVYGKNVYGLKSIDSVPLTDQGEFYETKSPKTGDILRDNNSVHWAIVKEVNGSTVTVIQQNAWNIEHTKAWTGAVVDVNDAGYSYFTINTDNNNGNTPVSHDFSFQYQSQEIYDTNTVVRTKVMNPERLGVQRVGCYVWDAAGNELTKHEEICSRKESKFNIWYDFNSELGLTLVPGTSYSYQFYVVYDGVEYTGEKKNFTTTGTAPAKVSPNKEYIADGLVMMQALVGVSEDSVREKVGEPVKVDGNKKYYPEGCNGLFGTNSPLMIEFEDGCAKSIIWKYVYTDSTYANESEEFYQKSIQLGNAVFRQDGVGICRKQGNETYTWDQVAEVRRDIENGIPSITVKVECRYVQ